MSGPAPGSKTLGFYRLFGAALIGSAFAADARAEQRTDLSLAETAQERQCISRGWRRLLVQANGAARALLWKGPEGVWRNGAMMVFHGGGGQHVNWCIANHRLLEPQIGFTDLAMAEGFAVFLLNSSDRITDNEGRLCGKVWDDEVRGRANLDLPVIGRIMRDVIPSLRPAGSRRAIFMTGLSSGGYMTVRAATHFDDLVAGFVPVSSGDPYGWHRKCDPALARVRRKNVHGVGFDNETGRNIYERDACRAAAHPNEKAWESARPRAKPTFMLAHHAEDGVNDISCGEKAAAQLRRRGYPEHPPLVLRGGRRSLANHFWQEAYTRPILEFFSGVAARRQ